MLWTTFLIFVCLLASTGGSLVRDTKSKEISEDCYYCLADEKGGNNIEACSTQFHTLDIEKCPAEDMFDRCLVFQAFNAKLNTTIVRRECSSERFCTKEDLCGDPEYTECNFQCCFGNLCNDFNFEPSTKKIPGEQGAIRTSVSTAEYGEKPTTRKETSSDISRNCYNCLADTEGGNNIETCSTTNFLDVEKCSSDDMFDRCLVFQAFSTSLNTTISLRECSSERFCTKEALCDNPDYTECNFKCCFGDLCNDFNFPTSGSKTDKDSIEPSKPTSEPDLISKQCYTCIGTHRGVDNIERCSIERELEIEHCPTEDLFDQCMVFQAFSTVLNTTIFRRECTSDRFCTANMLCADPDFVDCKYKCCSGDLCNVFNVEKDDALTTLGPEVIPGDGKVQPGTKVDKNTNTGGSLKCYYCDGDVVENGNAKVCSMKEELRSENCPDDENTTYTCLTFQAVSKKNIKTVRRECIPEQLCTQQLLCSSADYKECMFKCCTGDLCNNLDMKSGLLPTTAVRSQLSTSGDRTSPRTYPTGGERSTSSPIGEGHEGPDLSMNCYYCIGEEEGKDNIEACSTKNALRTETCSTDFDQCMVYQALSVRKNTVIFRRECTSKVFCKPEILCSDPELTDCQFRCCSQDKCNDFNFDTVKSTVPTEYKTSTSVQPTLDQECQDIDPNCERYPARPMYLERFCLDNINYTSVVCRKTCKFCTDGGGNGGNPQKGPNSEEPVRPTTKYVVQTKNTKPSMKPDLVCQDLSEDCPALATQNYCEDSEKFMQEYCRKSCGFCIVVPTIKPTTKDTVQKPTQESNSDGNTSTPVITQKSNTDGSTSTPVSTIKPTTKEDVQRPTQKSNTDGNTKTSECKDQRKDCKAYAREPGYCSYNKDFMTIHCPLACGFCLPGTEEPPSDKTTSLPVEECKDKREECAYFASQPGYCQLNKYHMLIECPKSCNLCSTTDYQSGISRGRQMNPIVSKGGEKTERRGNVRDDRARNLRWVNMLWGKFQSLTVSVMRNSSVMRNPSKFEFKTSFPSTWDSDLTFRLFGRCVSGVQEREVHCFHFWARKWHKVDIEYCVNFVGKMPVTHQQC